MKPLLLVLVLAMVACSAKPDASPANLTLQKQSPNGSTGRRLGSSYYNVTEACYDGIVYLVTDKGGITPKMVNVAAPFNDTSSAARVAICK